MIMRAASAGPLRRREIWLPLAGALLLLAGILLRTKGGSLDQHMLALLRLGRGNGWASIATMLSEAGGVRSLGPVAIAVVAGLSWRRRYYEALWLFLTITTGRLVTEGLKLALAAPRPPAADRLAIVTSWSFPSSHSAGSMMTCLAFALLATRHRRWCLGLAMAAACAIGWSRLALGVHWPSDVLAGLGFGMLWVGTAARWRDPTQYRSE